MTLYRIALMMAALVAALGAAETSYRDGMLGEIIGGNERPDIRLIAYGCDGASGPLYALEESDLPMCREIVALER